MMFLWIKLIKNQINLNDGKQNILIDFRILKIDLF
jgi:hypothetical protein